MSKYKRLFIAAIATLSLSLGTLSLFHKPASATAQTASTTQQSPHIRLITLTGTPEQIAQTHARELSEPIHFLFTHYLQPYFTSQTQRYLALGAATMFEAKLNPEHAAEIKALAADTQLDEREVMLAQCFLDLTPITACSTISLPAAASTDHIPRMGRNLDFAGKGVADNASVVFIYHPTGRYSFASISWPGLVGVLSGMNEHGLALANMELRRQRRLPTAMPYTLLYRTVLERCKTVNEAITLLQNTPRQSANNLMLMDATGDRAVVEIAPEGITVRRAPDTASLISTNHLRGSTDLDTPGFCPRYDSLHTNSANLFGHIDVPTIESLLAAAGQGNHTLQSMIFEPSTLTLYLSTGPSAYKGPFEKIPLAALLNKPGLVSSNSQ